MKLVSATDRVGCSNPRSMWGGARGPGVAVSERIYEARGPFVVVARRLSLGPILGASGKLVGSAGNALCWFKREITDSSPEAAGESL